MNALLRELRGFVKGKAMRYMPGMITCREFEAFIDSYLDGSLDRSQRRKFEWHIRFCRECRDYLDAYQRAIALGKAAYTSSIPPGLEDAPEDLIKAVLAARNGKSGD